MFEAIYEISLEGRMIQIDFNTWDTIRKCARSGKWFFVEHMGKLYRYVSDYGYMERPTRFDFVLKEDDWSIDPIVIKVP